MTPSQAQHDYIVDNWRRRFDALLAERNRLRTRYSALKTENKTLREDLNRYEAEEQCCAVCHEPITLEQRDACHWGHDENCDGIWCACDIWLHPGCCPYCNKTDD